ncbi:hypothetical protein E2N92_10025 [Methanofollis formosanus]|uniref:Uncharacterized protein n=1 Tax=Methanofollis formosanus TaxID=299308 RepID=A0A8G1EH10_9EURY|nr:hypothetical protein [Methanofollis formosanus]QYZ79739.1 hypothetical protein E2N92_10025 [Methanofollis formosanus]
MYKKILLAMALCLLCSVPAASAVLLEVTEKGTITALDVENGTMTILPDARYECNYSVTPPCGWAAMNESAEVNGTVPDPAVFSVFEVGDAVEVTSVGGEGGRWIAVGKLTPSEGTWYATDIVGDPATLPAPLLGNYTLTYEAVPDCANCTGSVCPAVEMNVTVLSEGMKVFEDVLKPGENLTYNGRNDNSSVSITFIRGEALSSACPGQPVVAGPQPISVFLVHVNPPIGFEPEETAVPTTTVTTTTVPTSSGGLLVPLAAGLLGCAAAIRRR